MIRYRHTGRAGNCQVETAIGTSLSVENLFPVSWSNVGFRGIAYLSALLEQENKVLGLSVIWI